MTATLESPITETLDGSTVSWEATCAGCGYHAVTFGRDDCAAEMRAYCRCAVTSCRARDWRITAYRYLSGIPFDPQPMNATFGAMVDGYHEEAGFWSGRCECGSFAQHDRRLSKITRAYEAHREDTFVPLSQRNNTAASL